jgi:hypothetical protein
MAKQSRGQKRAAKVASRRRKQQPGRTVHSAQPVRPVTTLPGPDDFAPGEITEITALDEMRYTVAEIRTVRQIGPAPTSRTGDVDPEWLEVLEGNLDGLGGLDEHQLVVEIIDDRVRRAVADTLDSSSPGPAREEVRCLVASDGEMAPPDQPAGDPGGAPAQALAFATLLGWLANRGTRVIPAAARTRVPQWAQDTLGADAARSVEAVIGVLGGDDERRAVLGAVADELGDEFLAALMWVAAGLVALYGDGDATTYLPLPETAPA